MKRKKKKGKYGNRSITFTCDFSCDFGHFNATMWVNNVKTGNRLAFFQASKIKRNSSWRSFMLEMFYKVQSPLRWSIHQNWNNSESFVLWSMRKSGDQRRTYVFETSTIKYRIKNTFQFSFDFNRKQPKKAYIVYALTIANGMNVFVNITMLNFVDIVQPNCAMELANWCQSLCGLPFQWLLQRFWHFEWNLGVQSFPEKNYFRKKWVENNRPQ